MHFFSKLPFQRQVILSNLDEVEPMGSFTDTKELEFGPKLKLGKVNKTQLWLGHPFREL